MKQQITNTILMIRPVNFRMNEQTAINNFYQKKLKDLSNKEIQQKALLEFNALVEKLKDVGVNVIVIEDTKVPDTPDSIFPNNWITFHQNGTVAVYPMFAENRRLERREDILDIVEEKGFKIKNVVDYTSAEEEDLFLEGTGSLVLDRDNRKAYCALSPRADEDLLIEFCEDFEYTPVSFHAYHTVNKERKLIYTGALYDSPAKMSSDGSVKYINGEPSQFFVRDAIQSTLENNEVAVKETRAHGCSVKYVQ